MFTSAIKKYHEFNIKRKKFMNAVNFHAARYYISSENNNPAGNSDDNDRARKPRKVEWKSPFKMI